MGAQSRHRPRLSVGGDRGAEESPFDGSLQPRAHSILERDGLAVVANEEKAAGEDRMVPGLARQGVEAMHDAFLFGSGFRNGDFPALGLNEEVLADA